MTTRQPHQNVKNKKNLSIYHLPIYNNFHTIIFQYMHKPIPQNILTSFFLFFLKGIILFQIIHVTYSAACCISPSSYLSLHSSPPMRLSPYTLLPDLSHIQCSSLSSGNYFVPSYCLSFLTAHACIPASLIHLVQ